MTKIINLGTSAFYELQEATKKKEFSTLQTGVKKKN